MELYEGTVEGVEQESPDGFTDITDRVEVHEKGKVLECDCSQRFGLKLEEKSVKCPSCGEVLEDRDWDSREEEAKKISECSQTSLGRFT